MNLISESGQLPIGVQHEGERCREYVLRPLKMRDSVEMRASDDYALVRGDDELTGLYLLGRRLTIAGVPREVMTLEFMLEMWDDDMGEVMQAEERLAAALRLFRGADQEEAGAAADEGRVLLPGGERAAGGGGGGVAGGLGGAQESGAGGPAEDLQGTSAAP